MRAWIDRMTDTENMIKYLEKRCRKCKKGCPECSGDVCETFRDIKFFNDRKKDLLEENGGVK